MSVNVENKDLNSLLNAFYYVMDRYPEDIEMKNYLLSIIDEVKMHVDNDRNGSEVSGMITYILDNILSK